MVTVPDFLGCSANEINLDEAILNTCEMLDLRLARMIEEGYTIPMPSDLESLHQAPNYLDVFFGVVSVDMDKLLIKTLRVHIRLRNIC